MIALACLCSGLLLGTLPADDARAAGLRGLVHDQGRWVYPDELIGHDLGDPRRSALMAEYDSRRSAAAKTADGQRALARWCDREGLGLEAVAHFTALTRLAPDDAEARRRLGQTLHRGRWMSETELAEERAEVAAQARADREWGPRIATWRRWLNEPEHVAEATKSLLAIRDPRAVPSLRRSFADRIPWEQSWSVKVLARIDSPGSSRALAGLAVFGLDESIRLAALRPILRRDPRTFVGLLINWLREPIRYEVVRPSGPDSAGLLRVEGPSAIVERSYTATPEGGFGPQADADDAEAQRAVATRQRDDIRSIERSNVTIELTNARVERALEAVTGARLGSDSQVWAGWWTSELGYAYESPSPTAPKPIVSENVRTQYVPRPRVGATFGARHSCFGAGTPVLARTGPRPIEDLKVGDQVLAQDPKSGELAFRPILAIFHNRPAPTLRVNLGGEEIVATPIHRFWKAGEGWAMARDLHPGDPIRALGRVVEVTAVQPDRIQPVYNLEVEGGHTFFVGRTRALVHDNSLVGPTDQPFDAGIALSKNFSR